MTGIVLSIFSALWLGILTSISPCPLATNVAAIGFISKKIDDSKMAFYSSIFYLVGRSFAYLIVAVLVVAGFLHISSLSMFLQEYMNKILGPLFILIALFLFNIIKINFSFSLIGNQGGEKLTKMGYWGNFLLGTIFALSFCPVSAALFFGSLIPLCVSTSSLIAFPVFYGIGTGLPVLMVAVALVFSIERANKIFKLIRNTEKVGRIITGAIFGILGIYFILKYIFFVPYLQF